MDGIRYLPAYAARQLPSARILRNELRGNHRCEEKAHHYRGEPYYNDPQSTFQNLAILEIAVSLSYNLVASLLTINVTRYSSSWPRMFSNLARPLISPLKPSGATSDQRVVPESAPPYQLLPYVHSSRFLCRTPKPIQYMVSGR